jgi:hypothetical protein
MGDLNAMPSASRRRQLEIGAPEQTTKLAGAFQHAMNTNEPSQKAQECGTSLINFIDRVRVCRHTGPSIKF